MRLKKFMSICLIIAVMFNLSTVGCSANVEDELTYNEEEIYTYLKEQGYPEEIIEYIPLANKIDIYNYGLVFAGAKIESYNLAEETVVEINIDPDSTMYVTNKEDSENTIQPFAGLIPEGDLDLIFTFSAKMHTDGYLEYMYVSYIYNWNNLPIFRFQDAIGVRWDSEIFQIQTGSFYKVDMYDNDQIHSEAVNYASASPNGVTWYADIRGYTSLPSKLYGYGKFHLEPKTITYTGKSKLYGNYVHATSKSGIGLTINSDGSWNITGDTDSNYEELGNDANATWG